MNFDDLTWRFAGVLIRDFYSTSVVQNLDSLMKCPILGESFLPPNFHHNGLVDSFKAFLNNVLIIRFITLMELRSNLCIPERFAMDIEGVVNERHNYSPNTEGEYYSKVLMRLKF